MLTFQIRYMGIHDYGLRVYCFVAYKTSSGLFKVNLLAFLYILTWFLHTELRVDHPVAVNYRYIHLSAISM